jgi:hypothetical protein
VRKEDTRQENRNQKDKRTQTVQIGEMAERRLIKEAMPLRRKNNDGRVLWETSW